MDVIVGETNGGGRIWSVIVTCLCLVVPDVDTSRIKTCENPSVRIIKKAGLSDVQHTFFWIYKKYQARGVI